MDHGFESAFHAVRLLLLCSFMGHVLANGFPNFFDQLQPPASPMTPFCDGYPGTPEWNQCWSVFENNLQVFQRQMNAFAHEVQQYQTPGPHHDRTPGERTMPMPKRRKSQARTSRITVNGYEIHSSGLNVSTSTTSRSKLVYIEADIGYPEGMRVTQESNTIKWETINRGRVGKWIKIVAPDLVDSGRIRYERKGKRLLIRAPRAGTDRGLDSESLFSNSAFTFV